MSILQSTQTKATTKRLRQQPAVRRERLVAAGVARVCAVCVLFPNTSAGLRTLPSPNAEPVPSLFISQHIQYYNQRRESRQEKPLLSLTRFFCPLFLSTEKTKMTNFVETSKSRNAKRTYTAIANVTAFAEAVAAFAADSTMGLTRKEKSAETYKTTVNYFAANNDEKGYVNLYLADKTAYEEMASFLKGNEAAETAAGVGGSSSRDESEDTWSAKFSCSLGEDTFTVTITREYMLINGFEEDATLAAVETWADTVEALGGQSA